MVVTAATAVVTAFIVMYMRATMNKLLRKPAKRIKIGIIRRIQ